MGEIHGRGVVHGDIRSENILIRPDHRDDVVFVDFARAKFVNSAAGEAFELELLTDLRSFGWMIQDASIGRPAPPSGHLRVNMYWGMRDLHPVLLKESDDWAYRLKM